VCNGCSHETLLHVSPQGLAGVFATTTKICTDGGSRRAHAQSFYAHRRDPPTHRSFMTPHPERQRHRTCHRRPSISTTLQRHPFSGLVTSAGELYTLLGGFRLPWPPSCCLKLPTPFMVSHKHRFRRFNSAFGSSHSASSAYQKWPTWHSDPISRLH